MINDGGNIMASSAERGNPNSEDYDFRTPLHVAALRGSYGLAKLLVEAGPMFYLKTGITFLFNISEFKRLQGRKFGFYYS